MTESKIRSATEEAKSIPRLIVLDDNPGWGHFIAEVAEKSGYAASYTTSHSEYFGAAANDPPDVLVLDLFMPEMDGIEMIAEIAQRHQSPLIIFISGQSDALLTSAVRLGQGKNLEVVGSLVKPFRLTELRKLLQAATAMVAKRKARRDETDTAGVPPEADADRAETDVRAQAGRPEDPCFDDALAQGDAVQKGSVPQLYENSSLRILRDQLDESEAADLVRKSVASVNARFCLALWEMHHAELMALNEVPARLSKAVSDLVANKNGSRPTEHWRKALRANVAMLDGNRALIERVANSIRVAKLGRSMVESIDRMNAVVVRIEAVHSTRHAPNGGLFGLCEELRRENERFRRGLSALLDHLKGVLKTGRNESSSVAPQDREVGPGATDMAARRSAKAKGMKSGKG